MSDFMPIREVTTYQKNWTIRGRVTNKTPIRTFGKASGGKVFSVDILDESAVEIRASFFNQAADASYDKLQKGQCYTFSKGSVRIANKQFNSTNHKYELVFDKFWQVDAAEDTTQIQSFRFSIVDIGSIRTRKIPCKVDLCGVVVKANPYISITAKDGTELAKREVVIADQSGCTILVILWGDRAKTEDEKFANNTILGLKGVLIKEWNDGRHGTHLSEGELILNPDIPEAQQVRQWWMQGGCNQSLVALSTPTGVSDGGSGTVVGLAELPQAVSKTTAIQVFIVFCRLHSVQMMRQGEPMPLYYKACQESKGNGTWFCNRRVDEAGFCAGCNRTVKHELKLNIRCHYSDYLDSNWIGTFHDPATQILGFDAEEASEYESGKGGRELLETKIKEQYYSQPLQLMVRAKMEMFNDQPRINVGVFDAVAVDLGSRGRDLLEEIRQMVTE
uniref:Replication protein A subunit n=1 Tax=Alexandrium monilatum TaxID=311494 RepID=A0A7S4V9D6_9DINO|mmetsp:Transcript_92684/g.276400  ORF Transcript_92684/g.276400 Transcript_92684/m.276400 type:complete len:447 (-) Transcript_92684:395-1735(-)